MKTYYLIPLASIPSAPSYKVWYATWSKAKPTATWSEVRPDVEPDDQSVWLVGVAYTDQNPGDSAISMGTGGKSVPPPPLQLSAEDLGITGFQQAFKRWLMSRSA